MADIVRSTDKVGQRKLIKNALRCLNCNDVIESKSVHDFVSCTCGRIFTDGGLDYQRVGYVWSDDDGNHGYEDLSMFSDD